jgi:pimeloyl-ACP methyl ester carboxylesterase
MTSTTLPPSEQSGGIAFRTQGQGEPLILLHGVGMQSAAWSPQIAALSATHRVIALDLPGHGGSAPLLPGSGLSDYVAWLYAALKALGTGPVNLAGHSMGALIAGGFAATHPDMLRRVALLNGVYCRDEQARTAVIARAELIAGGSFDLETPLTRWFGDGAVDLAARDQVAGWLSEVDRGGYGTAYAAFARGDATYADRYPDITCPFLALTGDGDLNSSPAMSRAMADAVQDGQALVIDGHRHMVNLTAPEAVNDALTDWLARPTQETADDQQ